MSNEQEKEIITLEKVTAAIEAILYAAGHPVEYSKLSEVLGLSTKDVKNMVEAMSREYNSEKSKRGVLLLTFPDSCQFATKEEFLPYIREALGIKRGGNLSASTMEALAVVAYNQPVTRAYVDAVRGVEAVPANERSASERIIVDHLRAATFIIGDGITPGRVDQPA